MSKRPTLLEALALYVVCLVVGIALMIFLTSITIIPMMENYQAHGSVFLSPEGDKESE